jgi:hypothetical protein
VLPILDSGRAAPKEDHQGFIDEQDLECPATKRPSSTPTAIAHLPQSSAPGTLGSIPPFGGDQWEAPPYQAGSAPGGGNDAGDLVKGQREAMEKSSLVYVRNVSAGPVTSPGPYSFRRDATRNGPGP